MRTRRVPDHRSGRVATATPETPVESRRSGERFLTMAMDSDRSPGASMGARLAQAPLSSKILLPASLVFIIDSFLPWQRACADGGGCVSASGWHGVGIIAVLCAIAVLVIEGLRLAGMRLPVKPQIDAFIVAGLAGAVLVFTVIKLLVDDFRGYGLWIGLIVASVLAAGAALRLTEATSRTGQSGQAPFPTGGPPPPGAPPFAYQAPPPAPVYPSPSQPQAPPQAEAAYAAQSPAYEPPAQAPASHAGASAAAYRLVIVQSPAIPSGSSFVLGAGAATVGRAPDSTVVLSGDQHASSRHALVEPLGDALWIGDLGSTNGTYVNGQAITGRTPLREGDVIRIGDTEIRIER